MRFMNELTYYNTMDFCYDKSLYTYIVQRSYKRKTCY